MTQHTDSERAAFEAVASDDGKWPKAIERDAKGNYLLLTTANGWMWWQAARRAPAVPKGWKMVPLMPTLQMQQAALQYVTKQHQTRDVYAAMLAAAPLPTEAQCNSTTLMSPTCLKPLI